ncbi:MAG: TetR/AcrR family transcriptional regulator [Candidatus Binatia bacterium]
MTRTALLDAAEALMLDEGYAAVTTRRIAARVGVNSTLVYYYFDTMDDLFIALFRRGAERIRQRWAHVAASPQPLWGLWDLLRDPSNTARTMEFIALANHRKAIRAEIGAAARTFHQMQLEVVSDVLARYGVNTERWQPASVIVMVTGIVRYLLIEKAFDVDLGHAETIALIEGCIRELEGERRPLDDRVLAANGRGARPSA